MVENTTHLFLATRFNCNKCHDHPFEKWNVDNYYQTAAFFSQIGLERDEENAPEKNIGGSAVENATPLFEVISDIAKGEVINIITGEVAEPTFPFPVDFKSPPAPAMVDKDSWEPTLRENLAAWITAEDNQYFAKSYANRIWGYLTGTGIIEPIDDIRAGNPPTNPELLDHLTDVFIDSGFNVRELMREICNSRTYQLSIQTNPFNEDDQINYSHGKARRLPAEVIFDAVYAVTGATPNIPGAKPGMRAAQLADAKLDTKSGFLANLGRPSRESACECDRQNDVQLGAVMALLNGPSIAEAVADPDNAITRLVKQAPDDATLIEDLYLRVLNRKASQAEIDLVLNNWSLIGRDHDNLISQTAEMESDWVRRKATLETQRFRNIAMAKADIGAYFPEYEKMKAETEAEQQARIAVAEKSLRDFELNELPGKQAEAIDALAINRLWTQWNRLHPETAKINGKTDAVINEDASVLVSVLSRNRSDYTLTIPVKATTISGIMLEALTDDSLIGFGPGLNENGNFVVTEFQLSYTTPANPKKAQKVKLVDARADFTQEGFDVKKAINGSIERNDKAWSVEGQARRPHWARFELEEPLIFDDEGGTLTVTIICRYSAGDFPLGKFRISATDSPDPLNLGLPADIASVLSKAPAVRDEEETAKIDAWIQVQDPDYLAKRFAWVKASRPLPEDETMLQLKAGLARAERPIEDDPILVQLRSDVRYSNQQAANHRLTAAQDLTWALINNSAFIFNH